MFPWSNLQLGESQQHCNKKSIDRFRQLFELINKDSLAADPNAVALLTMTVRDSKQSSHNLRSDHQIKHVECSISSKAIKFRVNGKLLSHKKYKALIRISFGFDQPCFFIQQSKATSLAAAAPAQLWGYLQETTGERLVCSMEDHWLKTRLSVKKKYSAVVESINKLRGFKERGESLLQVTAQLKSLKAEHSAGVSKLQLAKKQLCCQRFQLACRQVDTLDKKLDDTLQKFNLLQLKKDNAEAEFSKRRVEVSETEKKTSALDSEELELQEKVSNCTAIIESLQNAVAEAKRHAHEEAEAQSRMVDAKLSKEAELAKVSSKLEYCLGHASNEQSTPQSIEQLETRIRNLQDMIAAIGVDKDKLDGNLAKTKEVQRELQSTTVKLRAMIEVRRLSGANFLLLSANELRHHNSIMALTQLLGSALLLEYMCIKNQSQNVKN